jgi:hypothetical protein
LAAEVRKQESETEPAARLGLAQDVTLGTEQQDEFRGVVEDKYRFRGQEPVVSGSCRCCAPPNVGDDFEWKKSGFGSEDSGANEADILHITNQIRFAHAFIEVARQEYRTGEILAGVKAHQAAREAFCEAKRSVNELADEPNPSILRELQAIEHALANMASTSSCSPGSS